MSSKPVTTQPPPATMSTKPNTLNGQFKVARAELVNCEAKLVDELDAMKPTFKAVDASAVTRKHDLTRQLAEVRTQSRTVGSKRLAQCRERLAGALEHCVEPYREQLGKEIGMEKGRLDRALKD